MKELTSYRTPYLKIWLAFFIYTAVVASFIQLLLLPYITPAWHAGYGLLVGLDSVTFQRQAVELFHQIRNTGWIAWELRPQGQAPVGIAAAIYVLTGIPEPWILIPLNAALHASAAVILLLIVQVFLPDWRFAVLAVLPLLVYPSAITWYSQIHKDGIFILGSLLFLYGWIKLSQDNQVLDSHFNRLIWILSIFLGAGLVWVVRPYGAQMMQVLSGILVLVLSVDIIRKIWSKRIFWSHGVGSIVILVVIVFSLTVFTSGGIPVAEGPQTQKQASETGKTGEQGNTNEPIPVQQGWRTTSWLPGPVENSFYTLSTVRNGFADSYPDATTNIDSDIRFNSVLDVIQYIPRAIEIGLLAPFPNEWLSMGSLPANTIMKRVSAIEMTGFYLSFVFILFALWNWRKRMETWIIFIFSMGMILTFVLVICNVGSLYRVRYGFLMTLMAFGITGFITFVRSWNKPGRDIS